MKKKLLLALTLVISGSMMSHAGPADKLKIPGPDPNGRRGATVPYNRYEAEDGRSMVLLRSWSLSIVVEMTLRPRLRSVLMWN